MYEQSLLRAGLSESQATIYEVLLKNGPLPAGEVSKKAHLKRGLTYKALGELEEMGLVEKKRDASVTVFAPTHPVRLKELAEQKEAEAQNAQIALGNVLGNLISDFNLISGKPGVRFYEGAEGIHAVLEDSLTSKTEIYSYADVEAVMKEIPKINEAYVAKREKLKLKKKVIVLDTPAARKYLAGYHQTVTDTRFLKFSAQPFASVMQIYDGKISYITLDPKRIIGVIIDDTHLHAMHKYLFAYTWSTLAHE